MESATTTSMEPPNEGPTGSGATKCNNLPIVNNSTPLVNGTGSNDGSDHNDQRGEIPGSENGSLMEPESSEPPPVGLNDAEPLAPSPAPVKIETPAVDGEGIKTESPDEDHSQESLIPNNVVDQKPGIEAPESMGPQGQTDQNTNGVLAPKTDMMGANGQAIPTTEGPPQQPKADPYSFNEDDPYMHSQMGQGRPLHLNHYPPQHPSHPSMLPPPPPGAQQGNGPPNGQQFQQHPHYPHNMPHQGYPPHPGIHTSGLGGPGPVQQPPNMPQHPHFDPSMMMNHQGGPVPPHGIKQESPGSASRRSFDEFSEGSDMMEDDDPDDNIIIKEEGMKQEFDDLNQIKSNQAAQPEKKPRKKQNRFNGLSEEELSKRLLPDLIAPDLDILIIGINPGMYAAFKGHHYAGPGNHFWKCMFLSGLLPRPMTADDDRKLLQYGIGFTNIVERVTRGSSSLSRREIEEGVHVLTEKILRYRPKIAVFNGKGIYEVFCNKKDFFFGKQPEKISGTDTHVWVMPNSSARCAQLPRAVDKVPFYSALKKFCDYLKGVVPTIDENEVVFKDCKLQNFNEKPFKQEPISEPGMEGNPDYMYGDGRFDSDTGKKKRGRPPKPRADGTVPTPKRRATDENGVPVQRGSNPIDPLTGKKKRGRPKKPEGAPVSHHKKSKKAAAAAAAAAQNNRASVDSQDSYHHQENTHQQQQAPGGHPGVPPHGSHPQGHPHGGPQMPLPPFSPNFCNRNSEMMPQQGVENGGAPPHPDPRLQDGQRDAQQQQQQQQSRNCDYPPEQGRPDQQQQQYPYPGYPGAPQQQPQPRPQQQQQPNFPPNANGNNFQAPPGGFNTGQPPTSVGGNQQPFDSRIGPPPPQGTPNPPSQPTKTGGDDVASKSITGLESLVDQIPSLENDSGVFSGSGAGSHPNTPRSVGPYSPASTVPPPGSTPGGFPGQGFQPFPQVPGTGQAPPTNPYVPSTSESSFAPPAASGDNSTGQAPSTSSTAPSNFSVSSLVTDASAAGPPAVPSQVASVSQPQTSESSTSTSGFMPPPPPTFTSDSSFSVSSLTSSYAAAAAAQADMASKYSAGLNNPYMGGAFGSSAFGAGSFLGQHNAAFPSPMSSMAAGAAAMGMGAMGAYYGAQYSQAAAHQAAYAGAAASSAAAAASTPPGFPASPYPTHGLHVPNPGYPYSPYSQSPYSQSPYF